MLERRELLTATFDFAIGLGGSRNDSIDAMTVDAAGNIYVAGGFQGTVDFDPGSGINELTATGSFKDLFFAKYSSTGELQWAHKIEDGISNTNTGLQMTPTGEVILTGEFDSAIDFDFGSGNAQLDPGSTGDQFIAKYNSNGELIWAKQLGGTATLQTGPLDIDSAGNIYVTGGMSSGNADLDPGNGSALFSTTGASSTAYFVKLDSSGNYVTGGLLYNDTSIPGGNSILDIEVDSNQNIVLAGTFSGRVDFDPGTGTSSVDSVGDSDGFLAKITNSGELAFSATMGSTGRDDVTGVDTDSSGNIYVSGFYSPSMTFQDSSGSTAFSSTGLFDMLVARLSPTGVLDWSRTYGSADIDLAHDVHFDGKGGLYVTGYFTNTIDFDSGPGSSVLNAGSREDLFLLKLGTDGSFGWAIDFPGTLFNVGYDIRSHSNGSIFVFGVFRGTTDFDPGPETFNLNSGSTLNGFLVKLTDAAGPLNTAPTLDNAGDPELPGLAEDATAAGNIGARVSDIIAAMAPGSISDADAGAVQGIAVLGANQLSGKWQFSLDDGTNWTDFGATSSSTALLLASDASTRVRYLPKPNTNGTVGFTFVAWDQTSGTNGTKVAALLANRGGSSAFSPEKEDVFVTVTPVNDAPTLARNVEVKLPSIEPNSAAGNGVLLAELIASAPVDLIRDADKNALEGIAVIGANQMDGTWEFSVNGGTNWTPFGMNSPSQALLLAANPNTRVRFISTTNRVVTPGFTYVAWDQTSGANGGTADVSTLRGGTTAFSLAKGIARIDVKGSNVAPVLNPAGSPTLDGIASNVTDANNVGTLISDLIARMSPQGGISDADAEALKGIAIIGANQLSGTWQFTTNGGTTWTNIGATSGGNARLLASNANTRLRFKPNAGFTGTPGVTFIAWDQSNGANGTLVDASVRGGVSAFSVKKDVATVAVI